MKDSDNYYFDLISLIWEKKFTVIISTISFSLLAVLLSFSQNILFESKAILKARDSNETNSQGFGALGGLSNLVGVDIATEEIVPAIETTAVAAAANLSTLFTITIFFWNSVDTEFSFFALKNGLAPATYTTVEPIPTV